MGCCFAFQHYVNTNVRYVLFWWMMCLMLHDCSFEDIHFIKHSPSCVTIILWFSRTQRSHGQTTQLWDPSCSWLIIHHFASGFLELVRTNSFCWRRDFNLCSRLGETEWVWSGMKIKANVICPSQWQSIISSKLQLLNLLLLPCQIASSIQYLW